MTAFVPIPAREAAELLEAAGILHARQVLIDSAAAGLVKAYALAIQTFDTKGGCTTVNHAAIPVDLWHRVVNALDVDNVWSGGAVRLAGNGLTGGTPTVHVTGVGFGESSLQTLIGHHVRQPAVVSGKKANAAPTPMVGVQQATAKPFVPAPEPAPSSTVRQGADLTAIPAGAITVTVKVAMAATGLGRTTIDKLMGEGRLERRKVGGRTLITVASIEALLAG